MLVLTRGLDEAIIIDDEIKVIVLGIRRNQIQIGIDAPRTIEVYREEVFHRIQREKELLQEKTATLSSDDQNPVEKINNTIIRYKK